MKQSPIIGALVLLPPIVLILSLMFLPAGCSGGGGGAPATPVPTQGAIQIGFTDSPSTGFQSILLNVVSVRLNPSTDPNVSAGDPNWIAISAPPGVGAVGDLQIDLNQLQNNAKLFNSGVVTAQTYNQIEVLIDPNNPGSIVPSCSQVPPSFSEGCITYGMTFATGSSLRTTSSITVTAKAVAPAIIDFGVEKITPPSAPGGNYTITPNISVVDHTGFLGSVNGTVTGTVTGGLTINAELAGTNTIIESAAVLSTSTTNSACSSGSAGCFTLSLPAAPGSGTAYDLFLSGGAKNFSTKSGLIVTRGVTATTTFSAATQSTAGQITGTIVDQRFGSPIQAATIELLTPTTAPSVVVASTATDASGNYIFSAIPGGTSGTYTLMVLQSGFDPKTSTVNVNVGSSTTTTCTNGTATNSCNFALTSTTISGTVSIDAPSTSDREVMVIAEDSGTTKLENFTMVKIPHGLTQAPFTLTVPTLTNNSSVTDFDLIASAEDSFQGGAPSQITGHSIAVLSHVSPGATEVSLGSLNCLGHGSISGSADSPDSGTTVRLLQDDTTKNPPVPVAISETQVGAAGEFSFCVPPNVPPPNVPSVTYQVQRVENATPIGTPTGVPMMATPMPAPTSTPCPICSNPQGFCPGPCSNTPLNFPL